MTNSEFAHQIVEGTFDIPEEVDAYTTLILEEIGRIGDQMTNDEVTAMVIPEEFQYFWKSI